MDVRLLPFVFLCYILAYLDRVNVGFAKLQMLKDLSLSDAALATGAAIFFIEGILMIGVLLTFKCIPKSQHVRIGVEETGAVGSSPGVQPAR